MEQRRATTRALVWVAFAGQLAFVASWVIAGALDPGYSHLEAGVSVLAARTAEHPWIVTAGLIALGLAIAALGAALLIQAQILLDCSDGEIARWRKQFSTSGLYLDRFGHYLTETALPIALGVRADGGWDELGTYTTLGLLAAVLALLVRTESALVHVARSEAGKPLAEDTEAVAAPRAPGVRRLRRWAGRFPFFRAFVAVEATLLALAAALLDVVLGDLEATRVLVVALVPVAAITAAGHLLAILMSERLR